MDSIFDRIYKLGIVPVISLEDSSDAMPVAKALWDGGLPCAEITFRTNAALESIRIIRKSYPNMLVGAGTVLTTEQADHAIEAGAQFIVTPGFNPRIVSYCKDKNITVIPGCSGPSDIEQAIEFGLSVVKFFPAEASGGIEKIKALSAPYRNIRFLPTGGINPENINSYLSFKNVLACGGSWIANSDLIRAKDFDRIKTLAEEAVKLVLGFELKHIGINADDENTANTVAYTLSNMFGYAENSGAISIFVGALFEIMKQKWYGKNGHIAIQTNNIDRAMYYLSQRGAEFDMSTASYNTDGSLKTIYLKEEIGGFAFHLVQK